MKLKGKKRWLSAGLAGIAAVIAALVPATAPLVEAVAAGVAEVLIGTEEAPGVQREDAPPVLDPEKSGS